MKTCLLVIATFSLVSCIPVDDFGAYWGKAGIDRRLAGSWKWIGAPNAEDGPSLFGDQIRVIENNGAYEITSYAKGTKIDGGPFVVKTLKVGRYQFLGVRFPSGKSGFMERYLIRRRVLQLCEQGIDEFVTANYPQAVNMKNGGDVGEVISIALFDAEVFTILSKIPDTKAWLDRSQTATNDELLRPAQNQIPNCYCHDAYQRVQ
jgi:hypothetical protein